MSHEGPSRRRNADPHGTGRGRTGNDRRPLRAYVVEVRGREECTLAPVDPTEDERLAAWMTGIEGAFVALDARR